MYFIKAFYWLIHQKPLGRIGLMAVLHKQLSGLSQAPRLHTLILSHLYNSVNLSVTSLEGLRAIFQSNSIGLSYEAWLLIAILDVVQLQLHMHVKPCVLSPNCPSKHPNNAI
jgi:hypothetical protein